MDTSKKAIKSNMDCVINAEFIDWDELKNTTILITGATGLIGTAMIKALLRVNEVRGLEIRILALVRDKKRACERFKDINHKESLVLVEGCVESLPVITDNIDYIIHAASQTASKEIVTHAVETIETTVLGTNNLLKLAKDKRVRGFVYLSSMEVYGHPEKGHKVSEDEIGAMSPLNLRNSYPISKIMSESMCCAYAGEYSIPAMICRLTQTIGDDYNYNDNRAFAYFYRCIKEHKNIVLKTKGETERSYLHTNDAVTAILCILLRGTPGCAYNAADEDTYCSISDMAERLAGRAGLKVEYNIEDEASNGFPQTLYMDLNTASLKALGWKPQYS